MANFLAHDCSHCKEYFCINHIFPENHNCPVFNPQETSSQTPMTSEIIQTSENEKSMNKKILDKQDDEKENNITSSSSDQYKKVGGWRLLFCLSLLLFFQRYLSTIDFKED
jgi:hypothetical protein